ncbi:MAG: hypothetical protein J6B89_02355 [Bacilli bacterium]|nr:hypothetical protein [Bacilli bacterium]
MTKRESIETPKSLSSMEKFILPNLMNDFPDLNIQQIKSMAESSIIECLNAIEKKDTASIKGYGDKVISYVNSRISDLGSDIVCYDSIKIHKTVLNRYSKTDSIATLYLQTSFEYLYKKNNNSYRRVQDRVKTEFIYIIDESKIGDGVRAIGLNCPNCGAPITSLGDKKCHYCNSANLDIVRKTWNLNNFSLY